MTWRLDYLSTRVKKKLAHTKIPCIFNHHNNVLGELYLSYLIDIFADYNSRDPIMPKRARTAFETPPEPSALTHEGRQNQQHHVTPTKAAVLGTIKYLEEHKIYLF